MLKDAEPIVRFWQATEIFSPQPLPGASVRENVTDLRPGDPMPWEPGSRVAERAPADGKEWRHQVFGGLFDLPRVRDALLIACGEEQGTADSDRPARGQSALFACTVGADGVLTGDPVVSPCARAIAAIAVGGAEAVLSGDQPGEPAADQATVESLPLRPLSGDDLRDFAVSLAERLGVAALLEPRGLRVRSYQAPAGVGGDDPSGQLLGSALDADLGRVAGALQERDGGATLTAFLSSDAENGAGENNTAENRSAEEDAGAEDGRIDLRRDPLLVRDRCEPGLIPPGRWPADNLLARSEQFAVNEIVRSPGLFAVHAPPGTGTTAVFSDLVAAIVVERGSRLAELPSPSAAFGGTRVWGSHVVREPAPALTGFEIVLAAQDEHAGLADISGRWRDRAAEADYFPSTARLADSDATWALLTARIGDRADRRAFVERFWHGTVRGTDVLFRAGESMPAALRLQRKEVVDWPAAVARFRSALAEVSALSSERTVAAAALTRLSLLEQACEEASSALETAEQLCADLTRREPVVRDSLTAAEEHRRALDTDLTTRTRERPALGAALSAGLTSGLRAGREWVAARGAHRALRSASEEAVRQRDEALREEEALRAELASARQAAADAKSEVARLTDEMARLQEPLAQARLRWGDQVPDGPSQAETEDPALIERRELLPAWADGQYAAARAELFFAALTLHKALISAESETFERNLGALMDLLSGDGGQPPPEIALTAWQTFFLVVPVARVACETIGSLFAGLGRGSFGWLLAASAGQLAPQQVLGGLWRANRAVLAGDPLRDRPLVPLPRSGQQALAKTLGAPEEWAPGHASAQWLADRTARYGTWLPAGPGGDPVWVGAPLRVRRDAAAPRADSCDDGLLVFGDPEPPPLASVQGLTLRTPASTPRPAALSASAAACLAAVRQLRR
ncbi:MAG TPA: hypothetical protein VH589_10540 [Trebonia sp.]